MTAREVPAAAREEYGGRWSWLFVLGLAIERAGLDMASEPSAGVVGFTIGDLRRMYPEGLPEWIAGGFHGPRGGRVSPRTVAKLPDSTAVWL